MLSVYLPSSSRSKEIERSTRWRCKRRRRKSHRSSSVAGVHAAPPMPSLTPVAMLTSSHLGEAFDGDLQSVAGLRTASGRFPREKLRTSDESLSIRGSKTVALCFSDKCKEHLVYLHCHLWSCCWNGRHQKPCTKNNSLVGLWGDLSLCMFKCLKYDLGEKRASKVAHLRRIAMKGLVYHQDAGPPETKCYVSMFPLLSTDSVKNQMKKKSSPKRRPPLAGFKVMQRLCDWQCCLTQDF